MRALRFTVAVVWALAALACLPRVPVQRLDTQAPIALAFVVDPEHSGQSLDAPEALKVQVRQALNERNLAAVEGPLENVRTQRLTDARFAALKAGATPYRLLVELRVHFFSQLDGRYRWEVSGQLTAGRADGQVARDVFQLPVVLVYDHEKEAEALAAAAPDIAQRVATLLDGLLVGAATPGPAAATLSTRPAGIYFVMVDRFANGDASNDGDADVDDPQGFHGGDLRGVIDRLDWIAQLGFDTLWLSPVFSMRTTPWHGFGAFHGYWTWDLNRLEPRLGDEATLRELSDKLHARGMKLVLDLVLNHVGPDAPLLTQHPDWFHRRGGVEDWSDEAQLLTHDVHGLPDLAEEKPQVYAYLLGAARRWLRPG